MRALTESDILGLWDAAAEQHALDRALTVLRAADPSIDRETAARRPIGQRDRGLLAINEHTFGPSMEGVAPCPHCASEVEFRFHSSEILTPPTAACDPPHELVHAGWSVRFRLPDSRDLAAVLRSGSADAPERALLKRCVISIECDGAARNEDAVPSTVWEAVSGAMSELDPQAEIEFALSCPSCAHRWTELFDIADFLWRRIAATARRLFAEVDVIARAYHWSESEILALGPVRRRAYLERIQS